MNNDFVKGFKPLEYKKPFEKAYLKWKNELEHFLNTK